MSRVHDTTLSKCQCLFEDQPDASPLLLNVSSYVIDWQLIRANRSKRTLVSAFHGRTGRLLHKNSVSTSKLPTCLERVIDPKNCALKCWRSWKNCYCVCLRTHGSRTVELLWSTRDFENWTHWKPLISWPSLHKFRIVNHYLDLGFVFFLL